MDTLNVKVDGEKRQVPVNEVSDKDLGWYANECRSPKLKSIAQAEIARRGGGGASPRQQQAITAPRQTALVEGSFGDPSRVTAMLHQAAENYHLVAPASVCGTLPEGCEVCLSLVHINPDDPGLYKVGGKLGLDRVMLSQIAAAAGATMLESKRLDDGSHPHYCAWSVTIAFRLFDGQLVERTGNVEIDVREPDGAAYVEIVEKAKDAKDSSGRPAPRDPATQLLELRKFLTRHAESKAMNRAIAAMGVRRSYTRAELAKPFAVARLMFTGRSEDPATKAQFNAAIAESFLGGRKQLYGNAPAALPQHVTHVHQGHPPPPAGGGYDYEADGEELPPSEPRNAAPGPSPAPQAAVPKQTPKPPPGAGDAWEPEGGL